MSSEGPMFVGPGVWVPLDMAPMVAAGMRRLIEQDRRVNGVVVDPRVIALVELLEAARRVRDNTGPVPHGSAHGFRMVPPVDDRSAPPTPDLSGWVPTSAAAVGLGVSTRAIRKRCAAGTLPAHQDDLGHWLIDPAALKTGPST